MILLSHASNIKGRGIFTTNFIHNSRNVANIEVSIYIFEPLFVSLFPLPLICGYLGIGGWSFCTK